MSRRDFMDAVTKRLLVYEQCVGLHSSWWKVWLCLCVVIEVRNDRVVRMLWSDGLE